MSDRSRTNFSVNLIGHGSLVFAKDIDHLIGIEYITRNVPEVLDASL